MIRKTFTLFLLLLSLTFSIAEAQTVPSDEKAKELVRSGKMALKGGAYGDAANKFELALQRPFNRVTTAAIYYAGLSYFYQKEFDKSNAKFHELATKFPDSKYILDCKYHQALMMLESGSNNDRSDGLTKLYKVYSSTRDASLQRDALSTLRHFCFNVFTPQMLRQNLVFFEDEDKWIVQEALLFQLDKANDGYGVKAELKNIAANGGKLSPYMESLQQKYGTNAVHTTSGSELRIAVVFAWHLSQTDTAMGVPKASRRALEMYEGMLLAIDSLDELSGKHIVVKVFDNRGDTLATRKLLPDLEQFHPDIVLTEGSTSPAQILGSWGEKNGVVILIPRNPLEDLINNRQYVFLANPSLSTHGRKMAEYALTTDHRLRPVHFNDKTLMSKRFDNGWRAACDSMGHKSTEIEVCPIYKDCAGSLGAKANQASSAGDAVYLPLGSEEILGLLLSTFYRGGGKSTLNIYGHPDWEQFNAIDTELKTDLRLTYSTFYYDKNDSLSFETFKYKTIYEYSCAPTQNMVVGYDLMAYLLTVARDANPSLPLAEAIRKAPLYRGLSQDFHFNGKQDNQRPTLLRYENGTLVKVN